MMDLVSIILPSYNSQDTVGEAITSVLNQTYSNFELLIVDDCSSDQSLKIINKYTKDSRVFLYLNKNNFGPGSSRNFAIKKSKGSYICFLDSDDVWHPKKIELQLKFMKSKNIQISNHFYRYFHFKSNKFFISKQIECPEVINLIKYHKIRGLGYCLTFMVRSDLKNNLIFESKKNSIAEDFSAFAEILKLANAYSIDNCLGYCRQSINSRSSGGTSLLSKLKLKFIFSVLLKYFQNFNILFSFYLWLNYLVFSLKHLKHKSIIEPLFDNDFEDLKVLNKNRAKYLKHF